MQRYMVRLSYLGTMYRGSQKHVNTHVVDLDSIQGAVDSSLLLMEPILTTRPSFQFAGRTDVGVHALSTAAHVDLESKDGHPINCEHMIKLMNRYLINCGHQIRIHTIHPVSNNFHARHSAKMRTYYYRFMLAKESGFHQIPIAEMNMTMHLHKDKCDLERLKNGLQLFRGVHDFQTFSGKKKEKPRSEFYQPSFVRNLELSIEEVEPLMPCDLLSNKFNFYLLKFESRSFLYNQIRRIVGALFSLGNGKLQERDIMSMLQTPNHANYFNCAPAAPHGLYLANVEYDEEIIREIEV